METVHRGAERDSRERESEVSKSTAMVSPSIRFKREWSVQCVSTGFHAVTKTPVRPAYLPCSKTREGVYPAVKVERGLSGIRFRAASGALFCLCHRGKNPLDCSCSVVQVELCCTQSQGVKCAVKHADKFQNSF